MTKTRRLRRLFHRPGETVVGYDDRLLRPDDMRRLRELAPGPLRTMPFGRGEADLAAPLLLTFGRIERAEDVAALRVLSGERWREVWNHLAAVLAGAAGAAGAGAGGLRVTVRFDYGHLIVRGDVRAAEPADVVEALARLPDLAESVAGVAAGLPDGAQLLTARYEPAGGAWVLREAHGFRGRKWVQSL
ncbi:MAG: hypothetical protein HY660_02835 [Armatimonadetes bacterium]|nr:hypothetical protein [Armatimonadota bacterium]